MGKRNPIHKLPDYKGYSAYYYYDDEDKIWVGQIYSGQNGSSFKDMVAFIVILIFSLVSLPTTETAWAIMFGMWALNVIIGNNRGDDE